MNDYVRVSLETHLFFARIMKEHSLFLQAGFVAKDTEWIRRADFFRRQFEDLLGRTVQMSNRMVGRHVLQSGEIVTPYTMDAERRTSDLSGIPINSRITAAQRNLECGHEDYQATRSDVQMVHNLNERAVWLLNGLIDFKERLLNEVKECRMYTTNYPLLIDHITREARLYREMIEGMMKNQKVCFKNLQNQEEFWNCIMMEHAMFIRGLLDPSEPELMVTANDFVNDFRALLDEARRKDCKANQCCDRNCRSNEGRREERRDEYRDDRREARIDEYRDDRREACRDEYRDDRREARKDDYRDERREDRREERQEDRRDDQRYNDNRAERVMKKTCELRDFKATATEGLLNCQIKSIILPLLADHVLREANHYIRIQEQGYQWQEG